MALEDTLPRRLEVALRAAGEDVEVINCGVPGHNAENALGMLRGKALATRPDVVVYTFFANDVQPSVAAADVVIVDPIDSFADYPLRSALLQYLGVRTKAALRSFGLFNGSGTLARDVEHFASGGRERAREAVRAMRAACEEQGCALLVLVYPFLAPPDRNPYAAVDQAFARDCEALGVACVPLLGAFDDPARLRRFWVSPFDTHPTGEANERVARYLLQRPEAAVRLQSAPIPR